MIDQYTYDIILAMINRNKKVNIRKIYSIDSVEIVNGSLQLDENSIESLPTKVEENYFTATNCTAESKEWKKTIRIQTKKSIAYEMTKTISSERQSKIGVSLGNAHVKFNGEILDKSTVTVSKKQAESFSEDITEEFLEERTISPNTVLQIKTSVIKGKLKGKVTGLVVLDAVINCFYKIGPIEQRNKVKLSDGHIFINEPRFRETTIDGYLYSESYESTNVVYREKKLSDHDPICDIEQSIQLNTFEENASHTNIAGLKEYSCLIDPKEKFLNFSEQIEIDIRNSDMGDLFVWIWDNNTFGKEVLLEGYRLNEGERYTLEIVSDDNSDGNIGWLAIRADDPTMERKVESVRVSAYEILEIETQFA